MTAIHLELSEAEAVFLSRAADVFDAMVIDALAGNGMPVDPDRPAVTAMGKLAAEMLAQGVA